MSEAIIVIQDEAGNIEKIHSTIPLDILVLDRRNLISREDFKHGDPFTKTDEILTVSKALQIVEEILK